MTIYLYETSNDRFAPILPAIRFPTSLGATSSLGKKVVSKTIAVIGPDSLPAAKAALSAGEQNCTWEYSPLFS